MEDIHLRTKLRAKGSRISRPRRLKEEPMLTEHLRSPGMKENKRLAASALIPLDGLSALLSDSDCIGQSDLL